MMLVFALLLGLIAAVALTNFIYNFPLYIMQCWREEACEFIEEEMADSHFTIAFSLSSQDYQWQRIPCSACHKGLSWLQQSSLLAYLCGQFRCHGCRKMISFSRVLTELLIIVAFVWGFLDFQHPLAQAIAICFACIMTVLAFIDLQHKILPDCLVLGMLWLGLIVNSIFSLFVNARMAILSASICYLSLSLISLLYSFIRQRECFGRGDIKLTATFAAWFGLTPALVILVAANLIALIFNIISTLLKRQKFNQVVAFGPYLGLMGWLAFLLIHHHWLNNLMILFQ